MTTALTLTETTEGAVAPAIALMLLLAENPTLILSDFWNEGLE